MSRAIEIRGLRGAEQHLNTCPKEAQESLREAANKAADAAYREALIQITRVYTIDMANTARDMEVVNARGGSLMAYFRTRGRARGALNFNVQPRATSPSPGWTSKRGYSVEIIRGQFEDISSHFFWLRGRNGNVHLFRRNDPGSRKNGADYKRFSTVSTPQMLNNEKVMERVEEVTFATLEQVFTRGMDRRLMKGV